MKLLGFAFVKGYASAVILFAAPVATLAQAQLAPPNPQQERCMEAFADTPEEKAMRDAIGEPPAAVRNEIENSKDWEGLDALLRWTERRAIEVFGSEEAARAAGEKIRIEKYTRRLELLREGADGGHLPSLYRLVQTSGHREYEEFPGAMGPEEKESALRTLYEYHFPLAPREMAGGCFEDLERIPEPEPIEPAPRGPACMPREYVDEFAYGQSAYRVCTDQDLAEIAEIRSRDRARGEAYRARVARWQAETAAKREMCLDLLREGGFRGDMSAWETLARYDLTTGVSEVGIVPPVEHYAWLELEKMIWRESGWEDQYSVPLMHQRRLAREFLSPEQIGEAVALAEKYAETLWPRRITRIERDVCQLLPQFANEPDPYASGLLPR